MKELFFYLLVSFLFAGCIFADEIGNNNLVITIHPVEYGIEFTGVNNHQLRAGGYRLNGGRNLT